MLPELQRYAVRMEPSQDQSERVRTPDVSRTVLLFSSAAAVVLLADQGSKAWAASSLSTCAGQVAPRTFDLCLAFNQGMAFSLGRGAGPLISLVAVGIVIALALASRKVSSVGQVLMGIVAGGAIGNVIDRALREPIAGVSPGFMKGAVVDFLYSSFWPTFNIADSAIVVGGIALSVLLWRMPDPEPASLPSVTASASSGGPDGASSTVDSSPADQSNAAQSS